MNVTRLEKFRARLVHAMALSTWLSSPLLMADDGNLTQQLHIQQHKSRFQLMLEQVQERAQRRAAAGQTSAAAEAPDAPRTDLGDATQSMRREPGLTAEDRLLAVTTISFDIAGLELYPYNPGYTVLCDVSANADPGRVGSPPCRDRQRQPRRVRFDSCGESAG